MVMMRKSTGWLGMGFVIFAGLAWSTTPVLGQETEEQKAGPELKVGDKAPPLEAEKWLKGEPVREFEKGKVYVVEFWATWCGPCVVMMPHLSAVQKTYKDKGVTVIGTNIWEEREYTDETLKKVKEFVEAQGDRMAYTVAYDGADRNTEAAYMKAARRTGIPTTFVVDKSGKIAWIGHPRWIELPLAAMVADKWDPKTGPEMVEKAQDRLEEIMEKASESPKEALADLDAYGRDYPMLAAGLVEVKFQLFLAAKDYEQAYKVAAVMVDQAITEKNSAQLNDIAWTIVDPEGTIEKKDLDLALKAAQKADEFTKHEDPAIIDTLARVYFLKGDVDRAIELQKKAVDKAKGRMKEQLEQVLEEYQEAKAAKRQS